jgi:hypothetical protein
MATRWAGPILRHKASVSLPGKYAAQLRSLHEHCERDPQHQIDVLGYSKDMVQQTTESPFFPTTTTTGSAETRAETNNGPYESIVGGNMEELQQDDPMAPHPGQVPDLTPHSEMHPDQLSAISHMLMDEQFMSMDRVISLDDMIFAAPPGNYGLPWAPDGSGSV